MLHPEEWDTVAALQAEALLAWGRGQEMQGVARLLPGGPSRSSRPWRVPNLPGPECFACPVTPGSPVSCPAPEGRGPLPSPHSHVCPP